jgi:hypothetical protein
MLISSQKYGFSMWTKNTFDSHLICFRNSFDLPSPFVIDQSESKRRKIIERLIRSNAYQKLEIALPFQIEPASPDAREENDDKARVVLGATKIDPGARTP